MSHISLKQAIGIVDSIRADSRVMAVKAFKLFFDSVYEIAYARGREDMAREIEQRNAAAQQSKPKPASPFAMQEIAPGMFAMTLENPEQLFALLDMLESGNLPFSPEANNIVAKEASEMCVVYEPAECDPNCTSHDCHYMHREAWTVFRGKDRLASYPSEQEAKDAIRRHGNPYFV